MKFSPEQYYRASLERLQQAKSLYSKGDAYALAMYCGGLAVECLLRAFRGKTHKGFDGRHNLDELLKASGILCVDEDHMRRGGRKEEDIHESSIAFRTAMNEVVTLWHNNVRFASEARMRAHLKLIKRVRGIKGDPLKKNAADLIGAVQLVVNKGMVLWNSQTKS